MELWRSLAGAVEAELVSPQPEEDLLALADLGLTLENLEKKDLLTYRLRVSRRDWGRLKSFCRRRGDTLRLQRRLGLYWRFRGLLARPVLVLGLGLLLGLTAWLPRRVLFVEVTGNTRVPTRQILEAAADCGLSFGASRREIRSEKVKNALLAALPELQWAGVNTRGCVATVAVRERAMEEPLGEDVSAAIVAGRDGFILSATVTRGTALCGPGQTVKAGQPLITGYTDCGRVLRFDGARGEVFAQTHRSLEAVTPTRWLQKEAQPGVKRKIGLTLGKKRIIFWKDSGILVGTCGRMVSEYDLTLPGGFSLPVSLWVETYPQGVLTPVEYAMGEEDLSAFAGGYVVARMEEGTIENRRETMTVTEGLLSLTGEYVCRESIGQSTLEQVEDIHGKTD